MKVAVHMSMFCKTWEDDIRPHLAKVKELGFDGVEISLYGSTDQQLVDAFSMAKELGLEVICGTGVSEDTNPSSSDPKVREKATEYLISCVDKVVLSGGEFLNGVLYAPWQGFSEIGKEERWKNACDVLKVVGAYAADKGVGLNLEVINRFETDFFNRIEDAIEFLKMVDMENVKLLIDTFHMNIEEDDIYESLEQSLPYVGCIHITENHRGVPGTGHIDWKKIVTILESQQYEGFLDMETFVESGHEVGNAMFIWDGKNRNSYDEAEQGIQHIRSFFKKDNIYKALAIQLKDVFNENAEYLCKLDCEAGDGDHGMTISRGFQKACDAVMLLDDAASANEILKEMGYAMLANMGGASGPIFSSLFVQMAALLKGKNELDVITYKKCIEETIHAIHELTGTNRGEKTMMDALYGAKDACDVYEGDDLLELMDRVQEGAHKGSQDTFNMKATKGRAKFLQERSVGFLDAGSHSVYLILDNIYKMWRE